MPSCNTSPGITSNPSGTSGGLKERRSWPRSNEPGRQPLAKIKLSLLFKRRMTSYYEVRAYKLRYQAAEDLKQAVAGYLGITVKPVSPNNPAYPPTGNSQPGSAAYAGASEVNGGANGGIQTLYTAGTEQSAPRFVSGLPFDNPLSGGGQYKEDRVWIERSTN